MFAMWMPKSELRLACTDDVGVHAKLRIGAQDAVSSLQRVSPDQLFLSSTPAAFPAGCTLSCFRRQRACRPIATATIAHLVRLPRIVSVAPITAAAVAQPATVGLSPYEITGDNLEMIGQLSWDQNLGIEVSTLPAAIPGQGNAKVWW